MSNDDYKDDDTTEFGPQKETTSKPAGRTSFTSISWKVLNLVLYIGVAIFIYHEAGLVTASAITILTLSQAQMIRWRYHHIATSNTHAHMTEMIRRRVAEMTKDKV